MFFSLNTFLNGCSREAGSGNEKQEEKENVAEDSISEEQADNNQQISNSIVDSNGVSTWDCVYFGHYWQEDTNGDGKADKKDEKQPIKWRVLAVNGDDLFLLSDCNLDSHRYNENFLEVTWETCTLRSWLNGYGSSDNVEGEDYTSDNFIKCAFSDDEQKDIKNQNIENEDNPFNGTKGGNDTEDKIFLLSISEVSDFSYGFQKKFNTDSMTREAKNTEYAMEQGGETSKKYAGNGYWWLRSSGSDSHYAAGVGLDGFGNYNSYSVNYDHIVIRPAMHISLTSSFWRYAGKFSSN